MVLRLASFGLVSIFCEAILEVLQGAVVFILPDHDLSEQNSS
jgi:hypothetical protein